MRAMNPIIQDIRVILTAPEGINLVVVRVDTNVDGLYGLGCGTFAYRHLAVKCVVEDYLRPLLLGRDATAINDLWQLMHQNAYWRDGPVVNNAISGVDMALWDIKGKMANMPLYQLLGGRARAAVPVYRHATGRTLSELYEGIERFREQGLKHIRCQINTYGGTDYGVTPDWAAQGAPAGKYLDSRKYMRETINMFENVRAEFGDEIELVHDVHERIHPSDAADFAHALDPFHLYFLEDILPTEQLEWLRRIRAHSTTPIAIGELFNNPYDWIPLVQERLIDFIRVHLSQIGGITQARKLQTLCEIYGVRLCWHGPGDMTPMAHAANTHLSIASANTGIQEWVGVMGTDGRYDGAQQGPLTDVFSGLPELRGGFVYVSDKPGLGVDINEKEAAKYPCVNDVTTWTQTRLSDGSLVTP